MQRESALVRMVWIVLLVLLGGYVASDLLSTPFLASNGSAAVRPPQVTLWVPAPEAGGETAIVARNAAAGLELDGHTTVVKSLSGGSSRGVAEFLARRPRRQGVDLLVLDSATVADLAHDRRDRLVPGAAEEAALAQALLRRAKPLDLLAGDHLTLAVRSGSPISSPERLLESMRTAPWRRLFAIGDDTWSRAQLASLVARAGISGNVRFRLFGSGAEAGEGVRDGTADVALVRRSSVHDEVRSGRLRELHWPFAETGPRSWIALVGSPALSSARVARLRHSLAALEHEPGWRARERAEGREPPPSSRSRLMPSFASEATRAARLERVAERVERR